MNDIDTIMTSIQVALEAIEDDSVKLDFLDELVDKISVLTEELHDEDDEGEEVE